MQSSRGLFVVCALGLAAATVAFAAKAKQPDKAAIAAKLVNDVARVKAGDKVVVTGDISDTELVDEIMLAVMQRDAFPMRLASHENFGKRYFEAVPASYDAKTDPWGMLIAEHADVTIHVEKTEDPGKYSKVPPERLAAWREAMDPPEKKLLARNVRRVWLGNGLFPTRATAKSMGLDLPKLEKLFWASVNTDYQALQQRGAVVKKKLEAASQLRVQHSNGTDLTMGIAKRPAQVSDGVVDDADLKKGGAAVMTWLPAGEVYLTPVAGTATGTIVFDRLPFMDSAIEKLKIVVDKGAIVSMEAKPGAAFDNLKAQYDRAGAGKEQFGVFDVGINPDLSVPKGSKLVSYVPAGAVTLMFGGNDWAGGDNHNPFAFGGFLNGSTVTLDDQVLVDKGKLKLES